MANVVTVKQRKRIAVPSVVRTTFERPDPSHVEALRAYEITAISDVVGRMYTMNGDIRPLSEPAVPVVGVASTAKCPPGDNLAMIKALTLVQPGDVLVVDSQGFTDWCLGGYRLLDYSRRRYGLGGLIANGAYRDVNEAREAAFPVYAAGIAPYSGPKLGPGEVNVPVCCGGVIVHPGDVIAASAEGIVVVPRATLPAVLAGLAGAHTHSGPGAADSDADSLNDFVDAMVSAFDADARRL